VGKATGFLEIQRQKPPARPIAERIRDWREVPLPYEESALRDQTARCMDCGIPFCHNGCPLGNLIPEWNDLTYRDEWRKAIDRLHATNNFPEFTGRLCPAPCEAACVLGIGDDPVTIKQVEVEIINRAFDRGQVTARPAPAASGYRVAVVGSGPAGLAAAQQLARAGHAVTVYERDDALGGLLRYGIPDFKIEKRHIDRRLEQLAAGRHVVIIGGGDTAADCLGVAHRQGAASVHQLDIYPQPPDERDEGRDPWPSWPWILRNYPAHEEGGERVFAVAVQEFVGEGGAVQAIRIAEVTVSKVDGQ